MGYLWIFCLFSVIILSGVDGFSMGFLFIFGKCYVHIMWVFCG